MKAAHILPNYVSKSSESDRLYVSITYRILKNILIITKLTLNITITTLSISYIAKYNAYAREGASAANGW